MIRLYHEYNTAAADLVGDAPDAAVDEQRQSPNTHFTIEFLLSAAPVATHSPQRGSGDCAAQCRAEKAAFSERLRGAKKWQKRRGGVQTSETEQTCV